nr:otu domain-containing protein [Quercus suber]
MKPICLRELTLRFVEIDSHTIMKILRCCPLLEVFVLDLGMEMHSVVHLVNVPKLKKAKLYGISWVRVEAPNLEVFHCERFIGKLDNIACSKVKKLKLKSVESKQISIPDINYKFPFLETLYLRVLRSEKIKISSRGLKRLSLSCDDQIMPLLQINCENLHSFEFDSESIPKSFSITSSACLEKIVHTLWPKGSIDTFWFLRLRRYLGKFKEQQTLSLHFHPTTFLFQALVNRDEEQNCCSDSHMKCWRHYLKAVTAKYFDWRKRKYVKFVPKTNAKVPSANDVKSDHQRLLERLKLYNLVENEVKGDGNCQFRALADQLYGDPDLHTFVREQVIEQLKSQLELYQNYVPMTYNDYLEKMSKEGEWGDHVTLQAAADRFGVKIFLITSFKDTCYIEILPHIQKSKRVLMLSFWAETHYNSINPEAGKHLYNYKLHISTYAELYG